MLCPIAHKSLMGPGKTFEPCNTSLTWSMFKTIPSICVFYERPSTTTAACNLLEHYTTVTTDAPCHSTMVSDGNVVMLCCVVYARWVFTCTNCTLAA
jgi:hypothetical protein